EPGPPTPPPGGVPWTAPAPGDREPARWGRRVTVLAGAVLLVAVGLGAYLLGRSTGDGGGGGPPASRMGEEGKVEVQVPAGLVRQRYETARDKVIRAGFAVSPQYEHSTEVAPDQVISVDPAEGAFAERNATVSIKVSSGPPRQAQVPAGLTGATLEAAREQLIASGF